MEVRVDQALKTQIINSLAADVQYEDILLKLEEEGENAEIPTEQGKYRVKEGMLVFRPRSPHVSDGPFWKIVVPDDNEVKKVILSESHNVPYAGHPGVAKTLEHTARYFFWKGMSADVLPLSQIKCRNLRNALFIQHNFHICNWNFVLS